MADIEIKLGGKAQSLRPTFGAMREIEAQTGSSCHTLLGLLARHELHVSEMAKIVFYGMEAAGEKPTDWESCGNRIFEAGAASPDIRNPLAAYLSELLYVPDDAKKNSVMEWWQASEEITSQTFLLPPMPSDGDPETSGDLPQENSGPSSKPSVKSQSKSDE